MKLLAFHGDQLEYNGSQGQMEHIKLYEFNFEVMEAMVLWSSTWVLI